MDETEATIQTILLKINDINGSLKNIIKQNEDYKEMLEELYDGRNDLNTRVTIVEVTCETCRKHVASKSDIIDIRKSIKIIMTVFSIIGSTTLVSVIGLIIKAILKL